MRSNHSSILSEGKVLDVDKIKIQGKRNSKKVFYKLKRRVVVNWKEMNIIWKLIYIIEAPIKFLV
jgi:hypothetical protein